MGTRLSDRLPIEDVLPQLQAALERGTRAVLIAPPGAGKTTRVPLALLDSPWRKDGRIIMLEPRRLAARAAARRMAQTLGEAVGQRVGYRVRLESKVGKATRIEIVTEGVFTRMILDDPELKGVAALIFDEFHERSLDADLGLALALDATALREDLRIIVMSATIDGAKVANLLGDAATVVSEGRTFPVETRYASPDPLARLEDQIASTALAALQTDEGSVLVFLPGQREIARTAERLASRMPADVDIAPLYGQLSPEEQDRAIAPAPSGRRKIVLATSIAETSLTIEGIRIVIDSGFRRIPVYDPGTGLTTLEMRRVSRAGADQRRGRAGRTAPGICYRLWHEGQTGALDPFDTPEILTVDLAPLALDLASWGIGDPARLSFLDPPPRPAWNEAVVLLKQLDALDGPGHITDEGRALARLPLHPRLAHMVHKSADRGTAAELAALLTERGLGGSDTDLTHRLADFRHDRSRRADDARALARRWGGEPGNGSAIGSMLAMAFPDRVAQRSGPIGRYRLANGRAATLDDSNSLAREDFLVVTEITGSAAAGRIRGAASIAREEIEALFLDRINDETVTHWNTAGDAVQSRRRRSYGAVVLADDPVPIPDPALAANLLAILAVEKGLQWSAEQKSLLARVALLRAAGDDRLPDLSSVQPDDLAPQLLGATSLAGITVGDLNDFLDTKMPYVLRAEIDRLLPSHFTAPTGNRIPIDYEAENGPALEIRVQELFGLKTHPTIAGGKLPLLLILLSPAHRPIQTTRDLPGFWRGSWKDVVKDMRGRYPRHFWPDDPANAVPTARAKPRGT
ncbi:MAG TPA: ATP-dependent helicase HrpB [Devosia sp.]|nr:ATP-dependent helicase HrpB [Devosia sp.]